MERPRIRDILKSGVKTVFTPVTAKRESPAEHLEETALSDAERRHAAALMRINHCGEVCAQALYQGQALFARDSQIAGALQEAADEEIDHLSWTATRVDELDGKLSYLNPLWYGGAFVIGAATAAISDKLSLGFVAETERQVSQHLQSHLDKLPLKDGKAVPLSNRWTIDEQQHATNAIAMGGKELPEPAKKIMRLMGRVMTKTAYWV